MICETREDAIASAAAELNDGGVIIVHADPSCTDDICRCDPEIILVPSRGSV